MTRLWISGEDFAHNPQYLFEYDITNPLNWTLTSQINTNFVALSAIYIPSLVSLFVGTVIATDAGEGSLDFGNYTMFQLGLPSVCICKKKHGSE